MKEKCFENCVSCVVKKDLLNPESWEKILQFKKDAGLDVSSNIFYNQFEKYREKAKLAIRKKCSQVCVGLFKKDTHEIVDMKNCIAHHPTISKAIEILKREIEKYHVSCFEENTHLGLLRYVQFFLSNLSKKIQLTLVLNTKNEKEIPKNFLKKLSTYSLFESVWINVNTSQNNVIFSPHWEKFYGKEFLLQKILDETFVFHPACFSQINLSLFETLIEALLKEVSSDDKVLELYGGNAVISTHIAKKCNRVVCVEINAFSLLSFKETGNKKVTFLQKDVDQIQTLNSYDTIILDPPRKGLSKLLLERLLKLEGKKKIIYISCNVDSFLKDIKNLILKGWKIKKLDGYLLLPRTNHIEIFSVLVKEK